MAIVTDTLEGVIDQRLWYHYDLAQDVLYLRFVADRNVPTVAEETPDGMLVVRRQVDDALVGMTIVNWWKRFGDGLLPDSLRELQRRIEPWGAKLAA